MSRPVTFVRLDIAKFLLRVMKVPENQRGQWVTSLSESLAEGKRGEHPFADELFDEVDEFRENDRNRKSKFSKESEDSKDSTESRVSTTRQSGSQAVRQANNHPPVWSFADASSFLKAYFSLTVLTHRHERDLLETYRAFLTLKADEGEIRKRGEAYKRKYPNAAFTPNAVLKHWKTLQEPEDKRPVHKTAAQILEERGF